MAPAAACRAFHAAAAEAEDAGLHPEDAHPQPWGQEGPPHCLLQRTGKKPDSQKWPGPAGSVPPRPSSPAEPPHGAVAPGPRLGSPPRFAPRSATSLVPWIVAFASARGNEGSFLETGSVRSVGRRGRRGPRAGSSSGLLAKGTVTNNSGKNNSDREKSNAVHKSTCLLIRGISNSFCPYVMPGLFFLSHHAIEEKFKNKKAKH